MSYEPDPERLDDEAGLVAADPGEMLRQVATSGAQVREALTAAGEADLTRFVEDGRPRAVVVTGMGGSGIAGEVAAAVCGQGCPVPVVPVRGYQLPGWVGPADVVMAVSCSGATEETLAAADDAVRRGCRLLAVGGRGSPLAARAERSAAPFIPVRSVGQPRSTMWALSVPLLVTARALGLLDAPDAAFESAAQRLEEIAFRCRPASESVANPAKTLALELGGSVPLLWGASPLAGVAAQRFAAQLAENAKYPAIFGVLPEAAHNQVVCLDGPYGGGAEADDIFRDRVAEPAGATRLRLVTLRDSEEHPRVAQRAEITTGLAEERGVAVSSLSATGWHPLDRLAEFVGLTDYASVYLALLYGIDPCPVVPIDELKQRLAG